LTFIETFRPKEDWGRTEDGQYELVGVGHPLYGYFWENGVGCTGCGAQKEYDCGGCGWAGCRDCVDTHMRLAHKATFVSKEVEGRTL
jgi:hypothetical protein